MHPEFGLVLSVYNLCKSFQGTTPSDWLKEDPWWLRRMCALLAAESDVNRQEQSKREREMDRHKSKVPSARMRRR